MLKSKLFYVISIGYIALLGTLFRFLFPSVSPGDVVTVLALIGVLLAWVTCYALRKLGFLKGEA